MKRYKYVHLLWQGNAHFNKIVVDMINDADNGFVVDEHLFVTPYKHIFDEISSYKNVIFDQETKPQSADLVNKYAECGDWLFLHGLTGVNETLKIKRKSRKKIIWRTWGHDAKGYPYKEHDFIKNAVKWALNMRWKSVIRSFKLIGTANVADEFVIRDKFGIVPTVLLNYPTKNNMVRLNNAKNDAEADRKTINVLVGHSGISNDNHIEIINKLKKFNDRDVCFIFVLSYGDDKYIEKVKTYIEENCKEKSRVILEPMSLEEYTNLLANVDIAIFDGKESYALSNVAMLIYFNKKFFFNREGILAKTFLSEGIPFCCTDEIDNMDFCDFAKKAEYPCNLETSLAPTSYETGVIRWKKLLNNLK